MKENGKCRLLMGAYYMVVCLVLGYAAYYLEQSGFSSREIGFIVSGSCLAGGLLQAPAGKLADRNPKWFWKKQLIFYSVLGLLISALRIFVTGRIWEGTSYGLLIVLVLVMMPMVNSACFYYIDRGVDVDFGIARGTGSVSYALVSFLLGKLTAAKGPEILLICGAAMFAILLLSVLVMPEAGQQMNVPAAEPEAGGKGGRQAFISRYPLFLLMVAGITLAMIFQNMVGTYLINIIEVAGGGSDSLGIALAIAGMVELPVLFFYMQIRKKSGLSTAMLISVACGFFVLRGVLYSIASGVLMIYFVQLFQSVSYGLVTAAKATYSNEMVDVTDETTGQAVMSMTDSLSMVMGSLLGGLLLSGGGTSRMLLVGTALAAAGTIVTFIAAKAGGSGGKKNEE